MARVSRTLKIRTYTFGTLNAENMTIDNVTRLESPVKLGTRRLAEEAKARKASLLNTSETEVLWVMDLEDFYRFGHAAGNDDEDESGEADITGEDEATSEDD